MTAAAVLGAAGTGLLWGAAVGLAAVGLTRLIELPVAWWWMLAGPIGVGAVGGTVVGLMSRGSLLGAAGALDRALRLKDRLGTATALGASGVGSDPFAALAVNDAEAASVGIDLRRAVPVRAGRAWIAWPMLGATAVGVGLWVPSIDVLARSHSRSRPDAVARTGVEQKLVELARAIPARESPATPTTPPPASGDPAKTLDEIRRELESGRASPEMAAERGAREMNRIAAEREMRADSIERQRDQVSEAAREMRPPQKGETELSRAVRSGDMAAASEAARDLLNASPDADSPEARERAMKELAGLARDLRAAKRAREDARSVAESAKENGSEAQSRPSVDEKGASSESKAANRPDRSTEPDAADKLADSIDRAVEAIRREPESRGEKTTVQPTPAAQAADKPSQAPPRNSEKSEKQIGPPSRDEPSPSPGERRAEPASESSNAKQNAGAKTESKKPTAERAQEPTATDQPSAPDTRPTDSHAGERKADGQPQSITRESKSTEPRDPSQQPDEQGKPDSQEEGAKSEHPPGEKQEHKQQDDRTKTSPKDASGECDKGDQGSKPSPQGKPGQSGNAPDAGDQQPRAQPRDGGPQRESPKNGQPSNETSGRSGKPQPTSGEKGGARDAEHADKNGSQRDARDPARGEESPGADGSERATGEKSERAPQRRPDTGEIPGKSDSQPATRPDQQREKSPAPASSEQGAKPAERTAPSAGTQDKQAGDNADEPAKRVPGEKTSQPHPDPDSSEQPAASTHGEKPTSASGRQPGDPKVAKQPDAEGHESREGDQKAADTSENHEEGSPKEPGAAKPQLPTAPPSKEAIHRFAEQLQKLADAPQDAAAQRRQAQEMRRQAQELLKSATPEQRKNAERWGQELAREMDKQGQAGHGALDNDQPAGQSPEDAKRKPVAEPGSIATEHGSPDSGGGEPKHPRAGTPPASPLRTETVDARAGPPSAAQRSERSHDRVIAEWYADRKAEPRSEAASTETLSETGESSAQAAAREGERAVESQAVPMRFDKLLRKYFQRLPERAGSPAPVPPSPPKQAVPARDAGPEAR
jgi:hypothetical protein